jgi:hypothetical protein
MSTVELPDNMKELMFPSVKSPAEGKEKFHPGGMEIPTSPTAHELQGDLDKMKPNELIDQKSTNDY